MVDWGLIKIQYELFGETAEELADQFEVSLPMIKYAIKEERWQQLPIANAIQDWKNLDDLQEMPADIVDQVRDRMSILFTLKQSTLNPRYIAIETALLGKAQTIIQNLQPDHPNAASILRSISDVFVALREATGMVDKAQQEDSGGVKVNILTRVEGGKPAIDSPPVAVQITDGKG